MIYFTQCGHILLPSMCKCQYDNILFMYRLKSSSMQYRTTHFIALYTHILVFYFSAISRDIDLIFIQDTYRVVINSLIKQ